MRSYRLKKQFAIGILSLLLAVGCWPSVAQSLIIRQTGGSEEAELLNTVQKLSFSSGELIVDFKTGPADTYELSEIQKLYFETGTSVQDDPGMETKGLSIFPNPARETISINGIPDGAECISVYSSEGRLIITEPVKADQLIIDIGDLPRGLYFISAGESSSKFIRQ